ncbi:MAG: hypothetical protein ABW000_13125 [Actinoplanes sp.]
MAGETGLLGRQADAQPQGGRRGPGRQRGDEQRDIAVEPAEGDRQRGPGTGDDPPPPLDVLGELQRRLGVSDRIHRPVVPHPRPGLELRERECQRQLVHVVPGVLQPVRPQMIVRRLQPGDRLVGAALRLLGQPEDVTEAVPGGEDLGLRRLPVLLLQLAERAEHLTGPAVRQQAGADLELEVGRAGLGAARVEELRLEGRRQP